MRQLTIPLAAIALASGLIACDGNETMTPEGETVLEAVTPTAAASDVDPSGTITARFSGPMASGMEQYVDLHEGSVGGPVVPMNWALSADRRTITCTPGPPLKSGTTYTIHVGAGMTDGNGHPVETEAHGMAMGGEPVTGEMMGGMHGGQPTGMMGPGWGHPGDGHLGIAFVFGTA